MNCRVGSRNETRRRAEPSRKSIEEAFLASSVIKVMVRSHPKRLYGPTHESLLEQIGGTARFGPLGVDVRDRENLFECKRFCPFEAFRGCFEVARLKCSCSTTAGPSSSGL